MQSSLEEHMLFDMTRCGIRCRHPHAGLAHHVWIFRDGSLQSRLSGEMCRCHAGASGL